MEEKVTITFSVDGSLAKLYLEILSLWSKFPMFEKAFLNRLIFKKGLQAFFEDKGKDLGCLPEEMKKAFEELDK